MRYYSLEIDDARRFLEGTAPSVSPLVKGNGHQLPIEPIQSCAAELLAELNKLAPNGELSGKEGGRFEKNAVPRIHGVLSSLTEADRRPLYDEGFWRWLAVCCFSEVIARRHPARDGRRNLANYGIGSLTDNFVYRVWLRGEIGFDPVRYPNDPYRLAKLGDQDFWRSHIFRQSYAMPRTFARAFIRFQFEKDEGGRLANERVRELAKRLRRLYANVAFELLDEDEALALIEEESRKL